MDEIKYDDYNKNLEKLHNEIAELFVYFSCKNKTKICKNINIYCEIDEICDLYEYATLKIEDDIFLLKNKKANNKE